MRRLALRCCALALAGWSSAGVAFAAPGAVRLIVPPCEDESIGRQLKELLEAELVDQEVELLVVEQAGSSTGSAEQNSPDGEQRPGDWVELGPVVCDSDAPSVLVQLHVERAPRSAWSLRTEVTMSDVPPAERNRTLSIAIAELIRVTLASEQPAGPSAGGGESSGLAPMNQAEPAAGVAPAEERAPARQRFWRLDVHGRVEGRAAGVDGFWGAGVGLTRRLSSALLLRWGGDFLIAGMPTAVGPVDLWILGSRVGVEWLVLPGPTQLSFGPLVDVAFLRAQATRSSTGEQQSAVWQPLLTVSGRGSVSVPVGDHWSLEIAGELGVTLLSAQLLAFGQPLAGFSGPVGAASWGVGYSF